MNTKTTPMTAETLKKQLHDEFDQWGKYRPVGGGKYQLVDFEKDDSLHYFDKVYVIFLEEKILQSLPKEADAKTKQCNCHLSQSQVFCNCKEATTDDQVLAVVVTDEEITTYAKNATIDLQARINLIIGAKWMRDKLTTTIKSSEVEAVGLLEWMVENEYEYCGRTFNKDSAIFRTKKLKNFGDPYDIFTTNQVISLYKEELNKK